MQGGEGVARGAESAEELAAVPAWLLQQHRHMLVPEPGIELVEVIQRHRELEHIYDGSFLLGHTMVDAHTVPARGHMTFAGALGIERRLTALEAHAALASVHRIPFAVPRRR